MSGFFWIQIKEPACQSCQTAPVLRSVWREDDETMLQNSVNPIKESCSVKSQMEQEDGQQRCAKAAPATTEHENEHRNHPDAKLFVISVDGGQRQDIPSHNQIVNRVNEQLGMQFFHGVDGVL